MSLPCRRRHAAHCLSQDSNIERVLTATDLGDITWGQGCGITKCYPSVVHRTSSLFLLFAPRWGVGVPWPGGRHPQGQKGNPVHTHGTPTGTLFQVRSDMCNRQTNGGGGISGKVILLNKAADQGLLEQLGGREGAGGGGGQASGLCAKRQPTDDGSLVTGGGPVVNRLRLAAGHWP